MKSKLTKPIVSAVALLAAGAAASYYYAGWPDLRYLVANAQMRQRLDTEQLQRDYRIQAKTLDQQLRTMLPKDQDIAAKVESYNSLVLNCRKKYVEMLEGLAKSMNSFLTTHGRRSVSPDALTSKIDPKSAFPDTLLMTEIRVDSVSETPTSIRTDDQDLLKRYHADVTVTISVVMTGGKVTPMQNTLIANATPDKKWTFPSATDVKLRILTFLNELIGQRKTRQT